MNNEQDNERVNQAIEKFLPIYDSIRNIDSIAASYKFTGGLVASKDDIEALRKELSNIQQLGEEFIASADGIRIPDFRPTDAQTSGVVKMMAGIYAVEQWEIGDLDISDVDKWYAGNDIETPMPFTPMDWDAVFDEIWAKVDEEHEKWAAEDKAKEDAEPEEATETEDAEPEEATESETAQVE